MSTRGIGEVPIGGKKTAGSDSRVTGIMQRRMQQDMRQVALSLQKSQAPPGPPSNLKVTAQALGNLVQWTRNSDADYSEVLISSTPSTAVATVVNVGNTSQYRDPVGDTGITRYYWVRSVKNSGQRSTQIGYVKATTLGASMVVPPPTPPPPSDVQVNNTQTGLIDFTNERQVL